MKLPVTAIVGSIKSACILSFRNKNHIHSTNNHWHLVIPVDHEYFVITFITSQKNNRIEFYKRTASPEAKESLVDVNHKDFSFLNRPSIIECNQVDLWDRHELINSIDPSNNCSIAAPIIPDYILKKVVEAIRQSPIVDDDIKCRLP